MQEGGRLLSQRSGRGGLSKEGVTMLGGGAAVHDGCSADSNREAQKQKRSQDSASQQKQEGGKDWDKEAPEQRLLYF